MSNTINLNNNKCIVRLYRMLHKIAKLKKSIELIQMYFYLQKYVLHYDIEIQPVSVRCNNVYREYLVFFFY